MVRFRLLCTMCVCFNLVISCVTIQFYAPSLPPVAPPQNTNSISVGGASPCLFEYRQSLFTRLDLLLSGVYFPSESGLISTIALGPNLWLFKKEARPGFNMSFWGLKLVLFSNHLGYGDYLILFIQANQPHALRAAPGLSNILNRATHNHTLLG